MNLKLDLQQILFLDIETVSCVAQYDDLDEVFQDLWKLKCKSLLKQYDTPVEEEEARELFKEKAGIFAEFGKIICISVGILYQNKEGDMNVRLKSFADEDESILLKAFLELVEKKFNNIFKSGFCGHNIKEFDIPYICRRAIVNRLPLPDALQLSGKKPWDCKHLIDTMDMWSFGDRKNYTSLKLLAAVLGFPSPKDDIDGSEVGRVFWEENQLKRISDYCEKDVLATIQLYLRYKNKPLLTEEQVAFV